MTFMPQRRTDQDDDRDITAKAALMVLAFLSMVAFLAWLKS